MGLYMPYASVVVVPDVAWNPLRLTEYGTLSNTNRTLTAGTGASTLATVLATAGKTSGKWYWEVVPAVVVDFENHKIGVALSTFDEQTFGLGTTTDSWCYSSDGTSQTNAYSGSGYGSSYTGLDVIGVALDMNAGTLTFYKNNVSQGVAFTGLTGTIYPGLSSFQAGTAQAISTANFTTASFVYTPPTDHIALTA